MTNHELFSKTVQPLLDLFIAGFNTSILVYGESGELYIKELNNTHLDELKIDVTYRKGLAVHKFEW